MPDTASGRDVAAASGSVTHQPAGRGIAWYLLALCLAIILPVLALAGVLAGFYVAAERERLAEAALRGATAASLALDRDLSGLIAATEILSLSAALQAGDLDRFDLEARQVRDRLGVNVVMRDRDSRQVVNTRAPRGAPLPRNPDFTSDLRVLQTGQPDVSDLIEGAVTRAPLFIVNVPVFRDGRVAYFLNLSLPPEHVREAVRAGEARPGWTVTVLDRTGTVVADTAHHGAALGRRLPGEAWWREGAAEGVRRLAFPWDGRGPLLAAHVRSAVSGWTVVVGLPASLAEAPLRRSLALLGVVAVALIGLSGGLAAFFARRITRPVVGLVEAARRLGRGEEIAPAFTALREVDAVARALALAATERRRREAELRDSDVRLRLAIEAAGFGRWEVDLRTGLAFRAGHVVPARAGLPLAGYPIEEFLRRVVHPDDVAHVRASFEALAAGRSDRHRVEYRVRAPDDREWLWMESYGGVVERDPTTGLPLRVAGVSRDVSDRRAAEEQRQILLREVDHRAKNSLAVAQSVVALTRADNPAAFAQAVNGRIGALARAHTRLAVSGWTGTDLKALLVGELLPFGSFAEDEATMGDGGRPRIDLSGEPVELPGDAAAPVAMVVHELATNAAKHGALSVAGGRVRLAWTLDRDRTLRLAWTERGGPPVRGRPGARGFGSRMIDTIVRRQLGGALHIEWASEGLRCEMAFRLRPSAGDVGDRQDGRAARTPGLAGPQDDEATR